jgi:hypothetical protein
MCNLYSITTNQAAIAALFRPMNRYIGNLRPMPGVSPDYPAPVVRNAGEELEMMLMRWGMPPPPKTGGPPVTNSRASHLRRETVARNVTTMTRTYRAYAATLLGDYLDIRGQQSRRPDVYASDRYDASQKLGEEVRASGGAGLLYDSLRRRTGVNVVAHRPRNIADIAQTDHFEITVLATSRAIDVRKLSL